jgi:hypothetical protein
MGNAPHQLHEGVGVTLAYAGSRAPMTRSDWIMLGWSAEDADRYAAYRQTAARVLRVTAEGIEPLHHVVRHSPGGFEWGYTGSGPAELALAIVCDRVGLRGRGRFAEQLVTAEGRSVWAEPPYQRFKFDRIAGLAKDEPWMILASEVDAWLTGCGWRLEDALEDLDVDDCDDLAADG